MKCLQLLPRSFSLVEVTLALGVASFCPLAIFSLLPIGLKTTQSSMAQTAAATIMSAVVADMRATPKTTSASTQFGISFGSQKTLYFTSEGAPSSTIAANSRYQLTITFPTNSAGPAAAIFADLKITWPAAAAPANAAGASEMFAAFDRQ